MKRWLAVLLVLGGFAAGEVFAQQGLEPAPEGITGREIAERVEDIFRGQTSYMEATMTITSPRLPEPRRVRFQAWDDRPRKRSFIRILGPPKDKGMGFLKLHPNMWNYIPRVERTLRIPPSMMLQSWMGSDFSNDDLVRESSQLDDYDHTLLGIDPDGDPDADADGAGTRAYVLQYVPHEDAPVVWGKILTWVDVESSAPLRQDFFDERGEKLRVMRFSGVRDVSGRPYPHQWSMVPLEKKGHETRIEIHEIRFDEAFDDAIFTKRHLTRGGSR